MLLSVFIGMALIPVCGKIADVCNPQWILPVAYLSRASIIAAFMFIQSPDSLYAYIVSVLMVLGTTMEVTVGDCIMFRVADREIRGTLYGTATSCGYVGQLIFALGGGILFDKVGPKAPFMLVGGLDSFMFLFTMLLSCCGVIKNDI